MAEVRELYLSRYENAKLWQDSPTSHITGWKSRECSSSAVSALWWLAAEDYESARPDP